MVSAEYSSSKQDTRESEVKMSTVRVCICVNKISPKYISTERVTTVISSAKDGKIYRKLFCNLYKTELKAFLSCTLFCVK